MLNRNYMGQQTGTRVYQNLQVSDEWKLVKRFFIYDTLSGIELNGGYSSGVTRPNYVRWISSAKIKITLDEASPE